MLPPEDDLQNERCGLFCSVPKPVQSVQRAELWGVILALQGAKPVDLGVDNANVVGHVGRILAGKPPLRPFQLLLDGDLLSLVQILILARGADSTTISRVKGHAEEGLVRRGQERMADKIGNDMADEAADIGRWRVGADVNEVQKCFTDVCRAWYPVIRDLHRFFFLPFPGPLLMMTVREALLLTLWFGALGLNLNGGNRWMLFFTSL